MKQAAEVFRENEGFNRYIVECKLYQKKSSQLSLMSFNRYIVECKFSSSVYSEVLCPCFNRYIVECKSTQGRHSRKGRGVLIDT